MKTAIIFSTVTGQTEKLANAIKSTIGTVDYFGKPSDEALLADVIYVGSWTVGFSCSPDIKEFLEKLNDKKVFVFMTAGYNSTEEFFTPIIDSAKANINSSNEIIGQFICQGAVSEAKQEGIKKMDIDKYNSMKEQLELSASHPSADDIANLTEIVKNIK